MQVSNFTTAIPQKNASTIAGEHTEQLREQQKQTTETKPEVEKVDFQKLETAEVVRLEPSNADQSDFERGSIVDISV